MDSNDMNVSNISNTKTDHKNKKIDNRILTPKEKINNIDERLDNAKKRIKNLSEMQENVEAIAKSMNKCIDLLSKSINGAQVNNKFNAMRDSNKLFLIKTTASIEEETITARKAINELYKEKDILLKENKNYYNKLEETKEEKEKTIKHTTSLFSNQKNIFVENTSQS